MCTYFASTAKHFQSLTENDDIETEPFLDASLGIAHFVGFFGAAFSPVKSDIEGNVEKLRKTYLKNTSEFSTLKVLIDKEMVHRTSLGLTDIGYATEALLWLKRGLEFFLILMQQFVDDYESNKKQESLVPSCTIAYDRTLKRHHNFFAKSLFRLAVRAAPYRKDLMKLIAYGIDDMEQQCVQDIKIYIRTMKTNVECVCNFYFERNLETRLTEN